METRQVLAMHNIPAPDTIDHYYAALSLRRTRRRERRRLSAA